MKVSTGRGIKFFKHPVFTVPGKFIESGYNFGKKKITGLVKRRKKK